MRLKFYFLIPGLAVAGQALRGIPSKCSTTELTVTRLF